MLASAPIKSAHSVASGVFLLSARRQTLIDHRLISRRQGGCASVWTSEQQVVTSRVSRRPSLNKMINHICVLYNKLRTTKFLYMRHA